MDSLEKIVDAKKKEAAKSEEKKDDKKPAKDEDAPDPNDVKKAEAE